MRAMAGRRATHESARAAAGARSNMRTVAEVLFTHASERKVQALRMSSMEVAGAYSGVLHLRGPAGGGVAVD